MKNREFRALMAGALLAALVAGGLTNVPTYAKETTTTSTTQTQTDKTTDSSAQSSAAATKDETVYAKVDQSGAVKSIIVSDQLRNIGSDSSVSDVSDLKDIKNVKGDEEFKADGNQLTWSADGSDIVYQGTTDKELPVGVNVTYTLDGQEISASDLEGKSGHLKVRYQYENKTGSSQAYVPFMMVTGLVLDQDSFENITVDNGKLISDGERNMVIGYGLPGMESELGTSEIDIPDYFEYEADVTDYSAPEGITVATNDVFNQLDTDDMNDIDDLKDSLHQLEDASNQLVDGSGELADGINLLNSSTGSLVDGVNALADGSKSLAAGATTLNTNLATAAEKTSTELLPGIQKLDSGVAGMEAQMAEPIQKLSAGTKNLSSGAAQVKAGTSGINAALNQGTTTEDGTQIPALKVLAEKTATDAANLAQAIAANSGVTTSAQDVANGNGGTQDALNTLYSVLNSLDPESAEYASVQAAISSLESDQAARTSAAAELDSQIQTQSENVAAAQASLAASAQGVAQEAGIVNSVVSSLAQASSQTDAGMDQVQSGADELNEGINGEKGLIAQVSGGIGQLKDGTSMLLAGVDGDEGLAAGLNALSAGAGQLDTGAATLSTGLGTLQSGSGELVSGIGQLASGAQALNEGMIQFDEEGIDKLVDVFDGDVEKVLDKMNDMIDASKSYKNFSGISDKMDGSVKFIFVSE